MPTDYDGSFRVEELRLLRRRIPEDCILEADPGADDLEYLFGMVERTPRESGLLPVSRLPVRESGSPGSLHTSWSS